MFVGSIQYGSLAVQTSGAVVPVELHAIGDIVESWDKFCVGIDDKIVIRIESLAGGASGIYVSVFCVVGAIGIVVSVVIEEGIVKECVIPNVVLIIRVAKPHTIGVIDEGVVHEVAIRSLCSKA